MKSLATLIIGLFLFVLSVEAQTNRFSSTQGFSFEYPNEWVVLTKEQQSTLVTEYKAVFAKLGDIDFDRMAVMVFNPKNNEFPENVNVVVAPESIPINEDSRQKLAQVLTEQMRDAGMTVTDMVVEITKFGDKQAPFNTLDNETSNRRLNTPMAGSNSWKKSDIHHHGFRQHNKFSEPRSKLQEGV